MKSENYRVVALERNGFGEWQRSLYQGGRNKVSLSNLSVLGDNPWLLRDEPSEACLVELSDVYSDDYIDSDTARANFDIRGKVQNEPDEIVLFCSSINGNVYLGLDKI